MRSLLSIAALTMCGPVAWAAEPKPELMVVGMPHLANPARDIANTKVEDVLSPGRQREIEALVDRLAAFHPTHVAVGPEWEAFHAESQRQADEEGAFQRCHPIADWIRSLNDDPGSKTLSRPYFEIATFGDGDDNPGAAWVGAWYARNLRIYANLLRIGGKSGERTIAIFGAGHGPPLRSDALESGRFAVAGVLRYLPPRSASSCSR